MYMYIYLTYLALIKYVLQGYEIHTVHTYLTVILRRLRTQYSIHQPSGPPLPQCPFLKCRFVSHTGPSLFPQRSSGQTSRSTVPGRPCPSFCVWKEGKREGRRDCDDGEKNKKKSTDSDHQRDRAKISPLAALSITTPRFASSLSSALCWPLDFAVNSR